MPSTEVSTALVENNKDNDSLSKTLYVFAWIVEGVAVITGLFIAVMIGADTLDKIVSTKYTGNQSASTSDYINTIIAVLPFLLVAIVELAKIPVARATYKTINKFWKTIFALTLTFLALITFETSLNGFERNFSNLTFVIDKFKDELDSTEEKIIELERQKVEAESLNATEIEASYNKRREELTTDRDIQVTAITNRIGELKSSVKSETTEIYKQELVSFKNELQERRDEKSKEVERLTSRFEEQLKSVQSEVDVKRRDFRNSIKQKNSDISSERDAKNKAIQNAGVFDSEARIKKEFNTRIEKLEQEREDLESSLTRLNTSEEKKGISGGYNKELSLLDLKYKNQFTEIQNSIKLKNNEITKSIALVEADIKTSVDSLYQQQKDIENKFEQQLLANSLERKRQFDLLKDSQDFIQKLNFKLADLNGSRVLIRNNINQEVFISADISRSEVGLTAAIWFGSLAAIVALTGILLALASCVLADKKMTTINPLARSAASKLLFSIRKYYVYRQKRVLEPKINEVKIEKEVIKEVIKEVPVEKIVLKEIPKEIIRKQIVHVPMYTNDKDLVDKYNEEVDSVGENERSKLHTVAGV